MSGAASTNSVAGLNRILENALTELQPPNGYEFKTDAEREMYNAIISSKPRDTWTLSSLYVVLKIIKLEMRIAAATEELENAIEEGFSEHEPDTLTYHLAQGIAKNTRLQMSLYKALGLQFGAIPARATKNEAETERQARDAIGTLNQSGAASFLAMPNGRFDNSLAGHD